MTAAQSQGGRQWPLGGLTGLLLVASLYNLSYFTKTPFNSLPLQVALAATSASALIRPVAYRGGVFLLALTLLIALCGYNVPNADRALTNPIPPSLALMTLIAGTRFEVRNTQRLKIAAAVAVGSILIAQLLTNLTFDHAEATHGRFKGFGSGTLYSLMAIYTVVYIIEKRLNGDLKRGWALLALTVPVWTLYLTQSRGTLVTLCIIYAFRGTLNLRSLIRLAGATSALILISTSLQDVIPDIPILARLDWRSYDDLEQFTSGRLLTQRHILSWLQQETRPSAILLGAVGLNGIKDLAAQGYQFPHLDGLYIIYDAGAATLAVFVVLTIVILRTYASWIYFALFFISGLHTNMILSPTFLVFSFLLTLEAQRRPKYGASEEHSGHTGSNNASGPLAPGHLVDQ